MKKVRKVVMYVFRRHNNKYEFFCVNRKKGDSVVITGHVGDFIPGEKDESAVQREVREELGVETITIWDLNHQVTVPLLKNQEISEEHSYLAEISDQEVEYLKNKEPSSWHSLDALKQILTYNNQKEPLDKIRQILKI